MREEPKELHTMCTEPRLQEDVHTKVEVVQVVQDKGTGEDKVVVVSCKVGLVVLVLETAEGSSYAAVQKTAAVAHPPDCESVVIVAKCPVVVAPVKQTAAEVLMVYPCHFVVVEVIVVVVVVVVAPDRLAT